MTTKKVSEKGLKRSRGRPRKIVNESDAKKIQELFSENGHLLKNDTLANDILSKVEETSNSLVTQNQKIDLNNESPEKLETNLNEQISSLDRELPIIEMEYQKAMNEVRELEAIKNRLIKNKIEISSIIEQEQNLIMGWEKDIKTLPAHHFSADRSPFVRWLLNFFGHTDEITLISNISRSEALISQWKSRLVEVNSVLSQTLLALVGHEQIFSTISLIRESYRCLRLDLGKVEREFQSKLKDERNSKTNQLIMENYLHSLDDLKTLVPSLSNSVTKNNELVSKMFKDVKLNPNKLLLNFNYNQIETIENQDQS